MHYTLKRPGGRITVYFTPEERAELGLPADLPRQIFINHWKTAAHWLLDRGVSIDKAVRFLRRGTRDQSFWRVCALHRRYTRGTAFYQAAYDVNQALGWSFRSKAFERVEGARK